MLPRKRLLLALVLAGLVAAPAAVLAVLCAGNACERSNPVDTTVPFCSLPEGLRTQIAAGFRDGRSPHVMAVTREVQGVDPLPSWPAVSGDSPARVPLAFNGTGVSRAGRVQDEPRLDAVAPTIAEIIGLRRPHPNVRSGEPITGLASGERPRLVLLVVWKGVSSEQLERRPTAWPALRGLLATGAGSLDATPGSLPLDPAAILTTVGTGGLPRDHGITGSSVRNDEGEVVVPWSRGAPFSVIATLGDDLDELERQAPLIGVVGTDRTDIGLIGGNWYVEHDRDDVALAPDIESQVREAAALLASGYGSDETTDLLAVASSGPLPQLDAALDRLLDAARSASGGSFTTVVTSTGSEGEDDGSREHGLQLVELNDLVTTEVGTDVVEAFVAGGVFLDQEAMTAAGLSDDRIVRALRQVRTSDDERLFADVFPSIAVTFARYC